MGTPLVPPGAAPVLLLRRIADAHMLGGMTEFLDSSGADESCRYCGSHLLASVYDAAFRGDADADERLFFAIPGALCIPCRQLYVDRQLIGILGLSEAQCTFAIQSDRVLRAGAA